MKIARLDQEWEPEVQLVHRRCRSVAPDERDCEGRRRTSDLRLHDPDEVAALRRRRRDRIGSVHRCRSSCSSRRLRPNRDLPGTALPPRTPACGPASGFRIDTRRRRSRRQKGTSYWGLLVSLTSRVRRARRASSGDPARRSARSRRGTSRTGRPGIRTSSRHLLERASRCGSRRS